MITFNANNLNKDDVFSKIQYIRDNTIFCRFLNTDIINDGIAKCNLLNKDVACLEGDSSNHYFSACSECKFRHTEAYKNRKDLFKPIKNFAVITTFFNPQKSLNRYNNFLKFVDHMKEQKIPLYVAEGYYYKDTPQLTNNDCDNLFTFEYYDILWQKERLLNLLIEKLPKEIDAIGWFDADIIFLCDNLKDQCIEALSYYPVIQPWSICNFLNDNGSINRIFKSMAYYNFENNFKEVNQRKNHPGYAWCIRREELEKINGFYDTMICGNGDTFMAMGFYGHLNYPFLKQEKITSAATEHFSRWWNICNKIINKEVSYLNITINHLYHGTHENRRYWERVKCLFENGFDPNIHLDFAENKTYKYSSKAPLIIKDYIKDLLLGRKDDE
jgi:hypothetical protein